LQFSIAIICYKMYVISHAILENKKYCNTHCNAILTRMWANAQRDGRLSNIGGALCSTPQSLADAHY